MPSKKIIMADTMAVGKRIKAKQNAKSFNLLFMCSLLKILKTAKRTTGKQNTPNHDRKKESIPLKEDIVNTWSRKEEPLVA